MDTFSTIWPSFTSEQYVFTTDSLSHWSACYWYTSFSFSQGLRNVTDIDFRRCTNGFHGNQPPTNEQFARIRSDKFEYRTAEPQRTTPVWRENIAFYRVHWDPAYVSVWWARVQRLRALRWQHVRMDSREVHRRRSYGQLWGSDRDSCFVFRGLVITSPNFFSPLSRTGMRSFNSPLWASASTRNDSVGWDIKMLEV